MINFMVNAFELFILMLTDDVILMSETVEYSTACCF